MRTSFDYIVANSEFFREPAKAHIASRNELHLTLSVISFNFSCRCIAIFRHGSGMDGSLDRVTYAADLTISRK
jgi:hypothetical protein